MQELYSTYTYIHISKPARQIKKSYVLLNIWNIFSILLWRKSKSVFLHTYTCVYYSICWHDLPSSVHKSDNRTRSMFLTENIIRYQYLCQIFHEFIFAYDSILLTYLHDVCCTQMLIYTCLYH